MLVICSFFAYTLRQTTKIVKVVVIFFITIIVLCNGMSPTPLPSRRVYVSCQCVVGGGGQPEYCHLFETF